MMRTLFLFITSNTWRLESKRGMFTRRYTAKTLRAKICEHLGELDFEIDTWAYYIKVSKELIEQIKHYAPGYIIEPKWPYEQTCLEFHKINRMSIYDELKALQERVRILELRNVHD